MKIHYFNALAGAGKTRAMAQVAHRMAIEGERVLFIQPSKKLIDDTIRNEVEPLQRLLSDKRRYPCQAIHGDQHARVVTEIMRRKLLRRTRRQKLEISAKDLEDIERRAASAYRELREAWHFDYVIPNHDGEDSDNWEAFYYPLGDARKALNALAGLLEGKVPAEVEKWEEELIP